MSFKQVIARIIIILVASAAIAPGITFLHRSGVLAEAILIILGFVCVVSLLVWAVDNV